MHNTTDNPQLQGGEQPQEPQPQSKPRSGYARLKGRHRHLIEMHEVLEGEHQELLAVHGELETAFGELLNLHNSLLNDLRRAKPQPAPVRFGQALMGSPYGR
jgi:hypothetical protein